MLLTITNSFAPATDLGFLLHKHPDKVQNYTLNFGTAQVFYPHVDAERCTVCLLVDVDPVGLVRGKAHAAGGGLADEYVNDRPYAASSFLSVAIGQVFSTALHGRCAAKPELAAQPLPLCVELPVVPARGADDLVQALFEPLGYRVAATRLTLDEQFPEWGDSSYVSLRLEATKPLSEVLSHLYVLLPVLDDAKHYWVGADELEKLLRHGGAWLAEHPEKARISRRYLRHQWSLARQALARLEVVEDENGDVTEVAESAAQETDMAAISAEEAALEAPLSLNETRLQAVLHELQAAGVQSVVDLGCGDGKLLSRLQRARWLTRLAGLDVSLRALDIAAERLKLDRLPPRQRERISLWHGGLTYRDERLNGFDAATVVEVIEHLDSSRLAAFEQVLFACARPRLILVTTPNREYNVNYPALATGRLRHSDHRFEWTRAEFEAWAGTVAETHGYRVRFSPIGPSDPQHGAPTQMAVFELDGGA
ncbi:MAG: 3' terminal RNA ribose 2'-O-methyltransferase Hen1 [Gammaproteobacteria bacterium]